MARSFSSTKIKKKNNWRQHILSVLLFVLVLVLFFWGVSTIDSATADEKLKAMERAVTKAVVQCYALEGQYPSSVKYLEENYGLSVDSGENGKYVVHYDFIAGNIMPQIKVLHRFALD